MLDAAAQTFAGCVACVTCEQAMCCDPIMACINDSACNATVSCQHNCYSTLIGAAADTCASSCAGTSSALFNAYNICNGTTCTNACACP